MTKNSLFDDLKPPFPIEYNSKSYWVERGFFMAGKNKPNLVFHPDCVACGVTVTVAYDKRELWNGLCAMCELTRRCMKVNVADYLEWSKSAHELEKL